MCVVDDLCSLESGCSNKTDSEFQKLFVITATVCVVKMAQSSQSSRR